MDDTANVARAGLALFIRFGICTFVHISLLTVSK
jgi:hypothetical protein